MKLKEYLIKTHKKNSWLEELLHRHKKTVSAYVTGAQPIPYQDAKLIEIATEGHVTLQDLGHASEKEQSAAK